MEYNVGAVLVAQLLFIALIAAVIVAICGAIINKKLNSIYEKIALKVIPERLGTFFGYNGRVFTIESFDRFESKGKIDDITVIVDAFQLLDRKSYLKRNLQCTPRGGYYEMDKLFKEMCLFGDLPVNKGKYVTHNKLGSGYHRPAAFKLHSSDKHQYYLLTL